MAWAQHQPYFQCSWMGSADSDIIPRSLLAIFHLSDDSDTALFGIISRIKLFIPKLATKAQNRPAPKSRPVGRRLGDNEPV
jgi:hypothetical protein